MPGLQELIVIGVIVILIFGGKKFAELGKGLGEGISGFRKGVRERKDDDDA